MATSSSKDDDGNRNGCSWSSETNWTVAGGSLDTTIAFESSDSPIESNTVDAKGKPHLILKPLSPDCGPCEIKISFAQMHEVRQVYVRSTARVYEIYFAPSLRSTNVYLCTVRCGIAARDDEVLHAIDANEPAGACSMGYAGEKIEEIFRDDGNLASNLDDWIEVKVPDSQLQGYQHNSMPKKVDANPGISIQDFYEATAEMTDADGCISLTLRFLSLQSKGCLYVDEIYIFADLVESADSETQVANSAGSSLMAMLPTLLQLSRSVNNQRQDKHASDTSEKGECLEVDSGVIDSTNIANEIRQEESMEAPHDEELQEVNGGTPETSQVQIPAQFSDREQRHCFAAKTDVPHDNIERALEQLVSRVSRIEDICLRFEENMLKPISSMEARLQMVEQQVEMLAKNSWYSGLPSCTRISAPPFSCNGSNSSSFYNEGNDCPACGVSELGKKDISFGKLSNQTDDMPISVNDTQFLPSLVVTAPEFSCGDDEENNDALELPEDCPQEKTKQALSIDDALAAALAGFLYTTSVQPSHYTPTPTLTAPEFTIEENGNVGEVASPSAQSDKHILATIFSCECVNDSVLTSSSTSSMLGMEQMMGSFGADRFREPSEGVDGQNQLDQGGTSGSSLGITVNCPTTKAEVESAQTNDCHIAESTWIGEASNRIGFPVSERADILRDFFGNQAENTSDTLHEAAAASAENVKEGSEKDILQVVFKSPSAPCAVDFELPILDVKFTACETSSAKSPLEVLLTGMPEVDVKAPFVKQSDDDVIGEQQNSIVVDDGEPNRLPTSHHLLVDWDTYNVRDAPSSMEGEAPPESRTFNEQERFATLICLPQSNLDPRCCSPPFLFDHDRRQSTPSPPLVFRRRRTLSVPIRRIRLPFSTVVVSNQKDLMQRSHMASQRSLMKGKGKTAQRPPSIFKPPNVDIMKTQWTSENTNQFLQILSIQKEKSSRPLEFLTTKGWSTLIEAYYYATRLLHEKKQMKDQYKALKKDWVAWNKLRHRYTGLGYDALPGRIIADDEWWAEMIERDPRMAKFKESGLEHYELMKKVFSRNVAAGKYAWTPCKYAWTLGEARRPGELEEGSGDSGDMIPTRGQPSNVPTYPSQFATLYATDVYKPHLAQPDMPPPPFQPETTPPSFKPAQDIRDNDRCGFGSRSTKKKKSSGAKELSLSLDRVAESFNRRSRELNVKHFTISGPVTIGEALSRLTMLPGVESGDQLYLFGSSIFTHADTREMFLALPNDQIRLDWLLEKQKSRRCGGSGGSSCCD